MRTFESDRIHVEHGRVAESREVCDLSSSLEVCRVKHCEYVHCVCSWLQGDV